MALLVSTPSQHPLRIPLASFSEPGVTLRHHSPHHPQMERAHTGSSAQRFAAPSGLLGFSLVCAHSTHGSPRFYPQSPASTLFVPRGPDSPPLLRSSSRTSQLASLSLSLSLPLFLLLPPKSSHQLFTLPPKCPLTSSSTLAFPQNHL